MNESKTYRPDPAFARRAHLADLAGYQSLCRRAAEDPEGFWGSLAETELIWFEKFSRARDGQPPFVKWFTGGKTNVCFNCVDRHLAGTRADKTAILWEGEPGDRRAITYRELHGLVSRFANVLKDRGLRVGDRAVIYMPMVPEAAVAMLACARLGVTHSVVFGGFSAEALRTRIEDLGAKVVITADGGWRRGKPVPLKAAVDEAIAPLEVSDVIVLRRTGGEVAMKPGRDHWWHELEARMGGDCPAEPLESEHPLFVLYTSGTTGKPKGIVHATAGYNLQTTLTMKWVFDLRDDDIFWCTADIGWVTGHSYVVYGPLSAGATVLMYEGAPDYPQFDRWWRIVEEHRVSIFYTSPTAIRALLRQGDQFPAAHDLSSLRLLGSVGEPINPAAWEWYHRVIGGGRCPIVDTWWQTETGAVLIAPMPGAVAAKPGSATLPMPGIQPRIVDFHGQPVAAGEKGFLVIDGAWPSMMRTILNDPKRYEEQYWQRIPGVYFTGDAAMQDEDGYYWILGRVDDVINVSGHRLSTMEVESALVRHPMVAEAAVVARPDEVTGQAVCAFVTLKRLNHNHHDLGAELRQWVAHEIGAFARPADIRFTDALPKTRSGKIMRRLLREIVTTHSVTGDVTTLEDVGVVNRLASQQEEDA